MGCKDTYNAFGGLVKVCKYVKHICINIRRRVSKRLTDYSVCTYIRTYDLRSTFHQLNIKG